MANEMLRFLVVQHPEAIYAAEVSRAGGYKSRVTQKILRRFIQDGLLRPTRKYHRAENHRTLTLYEVSLRAIMQVVRDSSAEQIREITRANPTRLPNIFEYWSEFQKAGPDVENQAARLLKHLDPSSYPVLVDLDSIHSASIALNRPLWDAGLDNPEELLSLWLWQRFYRLAFGFAIDLEMPAPELVALRDFLNRRDDGALYRFLELQVAQQEKIDDAYKEGFWDVRTGADKKETFARIQDTIFQSNRTLLENPRARFYSEKRALDLLRLGLAPPEPAWTIQGDRDPGWALMREQMRRLDRYEEMLRLRYPGIRVRLEKDPDCWPETDGVERDPLLERIRRSCQEALWRCMVLKFKFNAKAGLSLEENLNCLNLGFWDLLHRDSNASSLGKVSDEDVERIVAEVEAELDTSAHKTR